MTTFIATAAVLLTTLAATPAAQACAVCLRDPESPLTRGMNAGIGVLLAIVVATLGGFAAFIAGFIRRSRQLENRPGTTNGVKRPEMRLRNATLPGAASEE